MISELINLNDFEIIKDDFIKFENPLENEYEKGFLYDDMFLAMEKKSGLLLDVGWTSYDDTFDNGAFKIVVIENNDWENPKLLLKAKKKASFLKKMKLAINFLTEYDIHKNLKNG